jgi:hypothetical protein
MVSSVFMTIFICFVSGKEDAILHFVLYTLQIFILVSFGLLGCWLSWKKPSVKNEKNMQRAPSASDDTVHKQLLIPKRTTSVNKLTRVNYNLFTEVSAVL